MYVYSEESELKSLSEKRSRNMEILVNILLFGDLADKKKRILYKIYQNLYTPWTAPPLSK